METPFKGSTLRAALVDVKFDVYSAMVEWDGRDRHVEIDVAETSPLVGMGLLAGHDVHIQAVAGGKVSIEARPGQ